MNIDALLKLKEERGTTSDSADAVKRTMDDITSDCRKYIHDNMGKFKSVVGEARREAIRQIIVEYVHNKAPAVDGYMEEDGRVKVSDLIRDLVKAITHYDILTQAMTDDSVFEIRVNGKEIWVESSGRCRPYTDNETGEVITFATRTQQDIVINKLLGSGDIRLTPKDSIVNARTIEGYRIAAVHCGAISDDPRNPTSNPLTDNYHAFVLRKFKQDKMQLGAIVKKMTMSDNMARFCSLFPSAGLTWITAGPTASGKTTTNNAILLDVPDHLRTVLIQNPSEIDLRKYDSYGRVLNDIIHLEAKEVENPTVSDPTMRNLIDHTLRLSPTLVCIGESRTNKEIKEGTKIMQAGHPINTTLHAETPHGVIRRWLSAYLAESGNEPAAMALAMLCDLLNIIIVQEIMKDGIRRVKYISEVVGVDPNDNTKALINDLYIFETDDEPEVDEKGMVLRINGKHRRVGTLSDKLRKKLRDCGISSKRLDYLLKDISAGDKELYTGEDIKHYGLRG